VRLFGQPPSRASRRWVGYLPQGLGLYDDLTIAENLAFSRAVFAGLVPAHGGNGPDQDLPDSLRRYAAVVVRDLPLGVARRAAFAQVLAHSPELLLLDEPTSGVDPLARARLWETISQAAADGAGVIVTTHSMEEAEECTRLVVMAGGRVVAAGTAAEIIGSARTAVVRAADWAEALGRLEAAGLRAVLAGPASAGPGSAGPGSAGPGSAGPGSAGPASAGPGLAGTASAGTALRVPGHPAAEVAAALGDLPASVTTEPATLEERFFELVAGG
jgi:ABC-2 type transport system ATP-binding protein/ribosome-dependent ATPase